MTFATYPTHIKNSVSIEKTKIKNKILLVDDSEIIRIYFRDIFWIHGLERKYDLTICRSIYQAENLIKDPKTRPRVVFTGLVMPIVEKNNTVVKVESGLSLLKMIKSDPELKNIIVVIFSGYDKKEYKDQATKDGADYFLLKHENMPLELVQFIENLKIG